MTVRQDRQRRYLEAAIAGELEKVRSAGEGGRALATFAAGAALGSLAGALDLERAEELLLDAALAAGLERSEALGHIRRGLRTGAKAPRELPGQRTAWQPRRPQARAAREQPGEPPPLDEVEALWDCAQPISRSTAALEWCERRWLDPFAVEDYDLARVMPHGAVLPRWARSRFGDWSASGHRLLVQLFDARGRFRSVRGRRMSNEGDSPKSLAPAGYSTRGLVMACGMGRALLAGITPEWWRPEVVIVEGEPDWLTWGSAQPEGRAQGPAVIGVEAGAWTDEYAVRVPDGARVAILTHLDEAGERYAADIVQTLRGRAIELFRRRNEGAAA